MTLAACISQMKRKLETKNTTPSDLPKFARKVVASSQKNPCADSFDIWHANKDNSIGTDSPWGTTR